AARYVSREGNSQRSQRCRTTLKTQIFGKINGIPIQ
ncbi:hypothetical protein F443_22364, partial [Phytophthora nicotianae P1569]